MSSEVFYLIGNSYQIKTLRENVLCTFFILEKNYAIMNEIKQMTNLESVRWKMTRKKGLILLTNYCG